jgi:hypothetical protein
MHQSIVTHRGLRTRIEMQIDTQQLSFTGTHPQPEKRRSDGAQ